MLETIKFINEHEDWRELLSLPPYCITIKEENGFAILKYSQIDSDFNEQICRECRGLIVDLHNDKVEAVALSFYKFFNVQETFADKIYWKTAKVQQKIDGSKILVWYNKYDKKWMVSTSGNLDAYTTSVGFVGLTFGDLFDKALSNIGLTALDLFNMLDKNKCYTFELVSPESRVVIPYKKTKLYFIGLRDVNTFEELDPNIEEKVCIWVSRPKEYPLPNLKSCLTATNNMGYDEEGFVVVDHKWSRVKIKSPAYVAAHRTKSRLNLLDILDIYLSGQIDDVLSIFPEYKEYFDKIINKYIETKNKVYIYLQELKQQHFTTRKDVALYIQNNFDKSLFSCIIYLYNSSIDFKEWFIQQSKNKKKLLLQLKE